MTSLKGEQKIRLSSTSSGVAWNFVRFITSGARVSRSPVRNSQARTRLPTLSGVIWLSGENRDPPRSPPQCSQAEAGSEMKAQKTATKEMNRRVEFRILPPQAQRNACGIDYPIDASVSTP